MDLLNTSQETLLDYDESGLEGGDKVAGAEGGMLDSGVGNTLRVDELEEQPPWDELRIIDELYNAEEQTPGEVLHVVDETPGEVLHVVDETPGEVLHVVDEAKGGVEDGVARTPSQHQEGILVAKLQPTRHFRGVPWRTENWRDRETRHGRECHVCTERVYCHPEVHVLQIHLPWFTRPTTACFRCGVQEGRGYTLRLQHLDDHQTHPDGIEFTDANLVRWAYQMFGLLHFIRDKLGRGLRTLDDMLKMVVDRRWWTPPSGPTISFAPEDQHCLKVFQTCSGVPSTPEVTIYPPNCVAALCHWKVLAVMLAKLPSKNLLEVKDLDHLTNYDGVPVNTMARPLFIRPEVLSFVDSHFHLDRMLKKTPGVTTFGGLEKRWKRLGYELEAGVVNCVFPEHWGMMKQLLEVEDSRLHFTFGIHPHHFKYSPEEFETLINHPRCVAIGEVGIDDTTRCECVPPCTDLRMCQNLTAQAQQDYLRELMPKVQAMGKPLVLHCRDHGSGEAAKAMMVILQECGMTEWPIHRHCFVGTASELAEWVEALPNCHFGFTALIHQADIALKRQISRLAADKILLESDAPYLSPPGAHSMNTPWHTQYQAQILADIRGKPFSLILDQTTVNARRLYRLK
jgi:TatD DNase family protein